MVGARASESAVPLNPLPGTGCRTQARGFCPWRLQCLSYVEQGSPYLLPKRFTRMKWDSPNKMFSRAPGR